MRIPLLLAAFLALTLTASSAGATAGLRIEIVGTTEQAGKLRLSVATADADGKPIPGLTAADFKATLNGTPLDLKDVQLARPAGLPASAMVVVDASRAMTGVPLAQERLAVQDFVAGLEPGDRVGIVAFGPRLDVLQEVGPERPALTPILNRIVPAGDADLYGAVSDAARRATMQPQGRRIVVLLTAGKPLGAADLRAGSLAAAKSSGAIFYVVGFGDFDRTYVNDLVGATGGRLVEVTAPTALRGAFFDLAVAVKSQYVLSTDVPVSIDRSLPGKLNVQLTIRGETAAAERSLDPMAGAAPPTFSMKVDGLTSGQKLTGPVTLQPLVAQDVPLRRVEYSVDGKVIHVAEAAPFSHAFDPASVPAGNHILKVTAFDSAGRRSEMQVTFAAQPAAAPKSGGSSFSPVALLLFLVLLGVVGVLGFRVLKKPRGSRTTDYASRAARPWTGRVTVPVPVRGLRDSTAFQGDAPEGQAPLMGRIILMDTRSDRTGQPGAVRQFELRGSPLSFGTGSNCTIRVDDTTGEIASEEARIWVQKSRMVYHKLTTLSAMATEGMVSGWVFLDDGEELHIGPYRIVFRAEAAGGEMDESGEAPQGLSMPA